MLSNRHRIALTARAALIGLLASAAALAAGPQWLSSPQEAKSEARERGSYILVDLYADWCGWCKVLERDVFTTEQFRAFSKDFVLLRVDVEDRGEGSRLQAEYAVSNLPTMLVIDADGIEVGSLSGFFPAPSYVARLEDVVEGYEASLSQFERVRTEGDASALSRLAKVLHQRRDGKRASVLYDRLLGGEQAAPQRAMLLTMSSDAQRLAGDLSRAKKSAESAIDLARELEQPILVEQAELLKAQIAHESGDCVHAEESLVAFLRAHPKSPMRQQARTLLSSVRQDTTTCG